MLVKQSESPQFTRHIYASLWGNKEVFMSKQDFTDEFKIEAVKQIIELGYSTTAVASRLGISAHSLYAWKKWFNKPTIQRITLNV